MYSRLGRIGVILPANNSVLEPEFYRILPEGVTAHFARYLTGKDAFSLGNLRSRQGFGSAAEVLEVTGVDVVVLACMASTIGRGKDWEKEVVREIKMFCDVPIVTAYSSTLEALGFLGIHRVSVGTPYTPEMHALVKPFLEADGLTVIKEKGLGISGLREVCNTPFQTAYDLALAVDMPDSQGICLLATDFPTVTTIERIEAELKKPAISSNLAIIWKCLTFLGVKARLKGYGHLLSSLT